MKKNSSKSEIEQLQSKGLKTLLAYLKKNSPFYKDLFRNHKVDIASVKTVKDLENIPVTTKDDLQSRNWDFLCVPRTKLVEYCTTSGTLGSPVTIALTQKDRDRLARNEESSFITAGTGAKDIFQFMLSLDRQFIAGIAYYEGVRKLGGGIIRVGPGNAAMHIDTMKRLNPTVLIAVPSFLVNAAEWAQEKGVDLSALPVRKVICIGENIRSEDFSLNALGRRITGRWNVQLHSTYASTEMQTAFTECEKGKGGHHNPELLVFEVLDENNKQLPPGAYGELAVTTLGVEGMPLLRYKTGDVCAYYAERCACGRHTVRISPVKGRKQQMVKYNGTTLFPQSICNLLNGLEEVQDYAVQLFTNDLGTDDIRISIALRRADGSSEAKIKKALQSVLRVLPAVNICSPEEVHRLQVQEGKRKANRIVDRRGV